MGTTSSSIDTDITNACAACGKEGPTNTCNKCEMVKYCNAACKKKHRSKHKKACERRVAELQLFKDHPPTDECPICFLPLPDPNRTFFKSCCGKRICCGCMYAMNAESRGRGKVGLCAFCRAPPSRSPAEESKRMKKCMDSNNAYAFCVLARNYKYGDSKPQNFAKANELYLKAGELGCPEAYLNLGSLYKIGRGVERDKKKVKHYWELAAMGGCVTARHNLGCLEGDAGNQQRARNHFMIAAKAGYKDSFDTVKKGYMAGYFTKDEFTNTLIAYQQRHDEMKSEMRDKFGDFYHNKRKAR